MTKVQENIVIFLLISTFLTRWTQNPLSLFYLRLNFLFVFSRLIFSSCLNILFSSILFSFLFSIFIDTSKIHEQKILFSTLSRHECIWDSKYLIFHFFLFFAVVWWLVHCIAWVFLFGISICSVFIWNNILLCLTLNWICEDIE